MYLCAVPAQLRPDHPDLTTEQRQCLQRVISSAVAILNIGALPRLTDLVIEGSSLDSSSLPRYVAWVLSSRVRLDRLSRHGLKASGRALRWGDGDGKDVHSEGGCR